MPAISKLRTPTWFVESPSRTPRRGSEWSVKNSSSAAASAGDVADLAADDDPRRQRLAGQLPQVRRAVVHDPGGRELRRADLDADELAVPRALREATRPGALRATRPPRLPNEVGKLDFLLEVDHWLHLRLGEDSEPVAGRAPELEEREVAALEQAAQLFRAGSCVRRQTRR